MQSRTRRNQVQNHSDRSSFDGEDRRATSNKRRKTESMDTLTKRPEGMYRFPQVIDLTGSQPGESAALPTRRVGSTVRPTSSMQTGTKKLVVKNLRSAPSSEPSRYYDHVWTQLSEALDAIFSHDTKQYSMEELYRGVENICRQEKAAALFNGLESRCREHVSETIRGSLIGAAQHSTDKQTLGLVIEAWATWKRHVTTIRSIFFYMDRSYLLHSTTKPSVEELGFDMFREFVFCNPMLRPKVLNGACRLLSSDRGPDLGDAFDPELFREAVSMFHTLSVYTKEFEPKMLGESQTFFREWTSSKIGTLNLAKYVEECHTLLESETVRCESFALDETTKKDLVDQMEIFLVEEQEERLTRSDDVAKLIDENELDALRHLFNLLRRKDLGEKIRPAFEEYINKQGESIIFDEQRESEMVVRLLRFKMKLDTILEYSFAKNQSMGHGLRDAFETFINRTKKTNMTWGTDNDKPGEMIAKYVDLILRGGSKAIPDSLTALGAVASMPNEEDIDGEVIDEDSQINKQLDQVLDMFRFVHGKAVFEAFYKKDLAKRLLMGRSASTDAEKSMLTRLKSECGAGFTHNLEQMFKDIELAREENTSYKTILDERHQKPPVDLNVNVLSASSWPTYPTVEVEIPADIQKAIRDFEQHYKAKHTGRKLEWKHALAHCQMKASFPKGSKEIIVSSFQAVVMLYFNGISPDQAVTFTELQAATKLSNAELERTLQSLACAKYRVLTKSPKGRDVDPTDKFMLNLAFTDPKYRIKINQIQLKETKEENKQTHERVATDRQYETQAAIVRIMKSKKKIKHALLVAEVIDATKSRGSVNAEDIKKQIDKLIDKDYIERVDEGFYEYIS